MSTERVIAYVDGYNLYYGLMEARFHTSRWLNLRSMCESLLKDHQRLEFVRYFTTRVRNNPSKAQRQAQFIDALLAVGGVEIDYGHFLSKVTQCRSCGHEWTHSEEKKTDVNIAVRLIEDAHDDRFDTAILISGDSDLSPAVHSVRSRHATKRVVVASPPKRHSRELCKVSNAHTKVSRKIILSSRLPSTVTTRSGQTLKAPEGWLPKDADPRGRTIT